MNHPSTPDQLPELAEADAPPEIVAIYRELRVLSAVPMVALIWRHLATRPGVLAQAWGALRPLFHSGALPEAAWHETRIAAEPARLAASDLAADGLDAEGRAAFARVLDAYNRANPVNFVAVRVLVRCAKRSPHLADVRFAASGHSGAWRPPAPIEPLPPMAPLAAFTREQRRLVDALSSDPRVDRSRVVPSLYRHLVAWPGLIARLHGGLAPRFQSGEMIGIIEELAARLDACAEQLAPNVAPVPAIAADGQVIDTLERFSALIPEMVAVGLLLRQGLET